MTPNFTPLRDNILVRRLDAETVSKGGILIPDTAQEKPGQAEVIAVGPGKRDDLGVQHPVPVKPGDTILFSKWKGWDVRLGEDQLLILREDHVLGVIERAKPTSGGGRLKAVA